LIVGNQALREVLQRSPQLADQLSAVLAERVEQLERYAAAVPTDIEEDADTRRSHILSRIRRFFSL
jgi:CRP-like cAMP-binding protein